MKLHLITILAISQFAVGLKQPIIKDPTNHQSTSYFASGRVLGSPLSAWWPPSGTLELRHNEGSATSDITSTTSSAAIPTITITSVPGLSDVLVENICLGMQLRNQTNNTDVLTYSPAVADIASRHQAAGCVIDHCEHNKTSKPSHYNQTKSCVEYPFASTEESGSGAAISCLPVWQSLIQGIYLSSWSQFTNLQSGQKFGVTIAGVDCNSISSSTALAKRYGQKHVADQGSNATLIPPFYWEDYSISKIILPLGDLYPGTFLMQASSTSAADSYRIVDNSGQNFAQDSVSGSSATALNFNLTDPGYGMGMVVYLNQTSNVTWTCIGNITDPTELANRPSSLAISKRHMNIFLLVLSMGIGQFFEVVFSIL